jgi:hypothetical protein
MTETISAYETSVKVYTPEDSHLYTSRREYLKSQLLFQLLFKQKYFLIIYERSNVDYHSLPELLSMEIAPWPQVSS